jgi:hypothetical protein
MNLQIKDREVQNALIDDRLSQFRRDAHVERMLHDQKQATTSRQFNLIEQVKRWSSGRGLRVRNPLRSKQLGPIER